MLAIFPLLLILGLFLPGFFLAKYFRHSLWWAFAFVFSLLALFQSIFWLGIFHVSIGVWTVTPCLLAATAAAALLQRKFAGPSAPAALPVSPPWNTQERVLLLASGAVGVVLLVHSAIAPLMGPDMQFRWDLLPQQLLSLGRFDYYPPLIPADFRTYFFVDGIPPLVSFTYWWLYAAAGRYLPALISLAVAAQFACTLAFTYGTASILFSRRAGVLAAAMLSASPLFFRSVVLGQETGLTALSIAATLYCIVSARDRDDARAMVSAGLAASLCALSREYGWIALIAGVIALAWRKQSAKQIAVFCAAALAAAGPWYLRNWMLAGNPFYSLRFAGFNVNAIHDSILHYYDASFGVQRWTAGSWVNVLLFLTVVSVFQILAGIPGGVRRFRRHGYLFVIALLLGLVWIQSIGFTSGGVETSTRVLSPVLAVLSLTAAAMLEPLTRRGRAAAALFVFILLCQAWTAVQGAVYPKEAYTLPVSQWLASAFPQVPPPAEFQVRDPLAKVFPPGYRVLSDSAYLHASMVGTGVEVVPVWSPEVRFLFSATPEEAERQLRALHIGSVVCYPKTTNMAYLVSASPFYAALPNRWKLLTHVGDFLFIMVPRNP